LAFFEPLTGEWVFNMTNVPSGTTYRDDMGSLVKYSISGSRLTRWNSSWAVTRGRTGMSESWGSQVTGRSIDASLGYDLNVSIPALAAGNKLPGTVQTIFVNDRIIGGSISLTQVNLWGLDLTPGYEGALLFNSTWAAPAEWVQANMTISGFQGGWCAWSKDSKVGVIWTKENRVHYGFSLETGKYLWATKPQPFQDAWSGVANEENHIAYDKLYSAAIAGTVYCYDVKDGSLLWTYNATDPYHESYLSNNWWIRVVFISDGKIYVGTMEHSPLNPLPRSAPFICLNATTGALIWRADGLFRQTAWGGCAIIGDSVIATMDTYDQRVYAIGKGSSTMTVTAPTTAVPLRTPVIIRGTVMDVSPGTEDEAVKLRFPKGVPAVSDASMSEWMLYVYKQFAQPTDVTGVAVSIDAMDPNHNYVHLGDAATDASGMFSVAVTPEVPGYYTVYATFAGSAAYSASYAETSLDILPAPAATAAPTPTPVPVLEAYFVLAVISIVITIVIVGAILGTLLIRKRAKTSKNT
jgi:outer membrane protein assembly factor BamB